MKTISVEIHIIIDEIMIIPAFMSRLILLRPDPNWRMLLHAKDTRGECCGTVQLEPAPE